MDPEEIIGKRLRCYPGLEAEGSYLHKRFKLVGYLGLTSVDVTIQLRIGEPARRLRLLEAKP